MTPSLSRAVASRATAAGWAALSLAAALGAAACTSSGGPPREAPRCGVLVAANGVDFRTDAWVANVAVGDLDEDGKADVAAASGRGDVVTVLRGNGDGTFVRAGSFATGPGPGWSIAAGDVDGDHHLDLAVANSSSTTVSVLRGRGDGTFEPRIDAATGANPGWVELADVNRDGKPDLVTANGEGTVSVLLGKGDGTFPTRSDLAARGAWSMVTAGDLDGDGKPDLVAAELEAGGVRVFLGGGDGTFAPKGFFATGAAAGRIALGDLDGDGKLDLAVANQGAFPAVSVLLGNGDGTFRAKPDHSLASVPAAVAIADFDGDGRRDLAVTVGEGAVTVLPGLGNGAFGAGSSQAAGLRWPNTTVTADVTGDGRPDVVVVNWGSATGPAYSVGALVNTCAPTLVVSPLRAVALRNDVPTTFSATLGGDALDVAWALSRPVGTLSRASGPSVAYSPPADAGPLEEVWLSASTATALVRTPIRVGPLVARPLGTGTAPSGFVEYLPPGYGDGQSRPLLVYLQGAGAAGNGTTELSNVVGEDPTGLILAGDWPPSRPFIVLAPQQHPAFGCFNAAEIQAFLAWAIASYDVDPRSVFLTGLSCGAMGAWEYLGWYGDTQVAAVVLVAGDPGAAWPNAGCNLARVAIWALHGDADTWVPYAPEQAVMNQLLACPAPRREIVYTLIPGWGHFIGGDIYNLNLGHDVYGWLLANAKP